MNPRVRASLIVIVLVAAASIGGYFIWKNKKEGVQQVQQIYDPIRVSTSTDFTWKKYENNSFELEYPSLASVMEVGNIVTLRHAIPFSHPNPCDFQGDARPLERLTDFQLSLMIQNKNLRDSVQINEGSDSIVNNFFESNTPSFSDGFIDPFKAGELDGIRITSGAEGCGKHSYYFEISPGKTLVINQPFVAEFNIEGFEKYKNFPGIVSPSKASEFLNRILSSFKAK